MIDDEDLIEILVDDIQLGHDPDGLPRVEPVEKPKPVEAKKPADKAKPAIDVDLLNKQLDEQKRSHEELRQARLKDQAEAQAAIEAANKARTAAEGERDKNTDLAMRAHWSRVNAEHQALESHVNSTKQLADSARAEIRAAKEAGDLDRELAANDRLIEATADLRELERGRHAAKAEVDRAREAFQTAAKEPPAREERKPDPKPAEEPAKKTADEWINGFPRKTRTWLNEHKDYVTDPAKHQELLSFANEWAEDYGQSTLHTPAFIEALNAKFAPPKVEDEEPEMADEVAEEPEVVDVAEKPQARKAVTSAPVSRNASPTRPSTGKINLTAEQYGIAPDLYPSSDYDGFSPETKRKFPSWSPTAARFQYHEDLRRAQKEKPHRFS